MRADSFFCTAGMAGRLSLIFLVAILLHGCKTEIDSEDPAIIGVPPEDAYLGVEYYYNFGAVDKDDILSYSLSNAPSWLALEDTTNKARQGVIIRGVPGITGGQRGREDLGRTTRINLVGNDGASLGAQPFSVDVRENQLSVVSRDYPEGGEESEAEPSDSLDYQCEAPTLEGTGQHTYQINEYDDAGNVTGTKTITSETQPILVQINLEQPSVTTVKVAFELQSAYDPSRCDDGFSPPHQRCDNSLANSDEATIGQDVVGLGSGSGGTFPLPDYFSFQQDDNGQFTKGVLTFEPGITECYVRLEVVDDAEPEDLEAFTFALTEIRSGIAGLGQSSAGVREPLRVEDNEPSVRLETVQGGVRDVANLGSTTEYVAILEGARQESYSAKLGPQDGSDAVLGTDYFLEVRNPDFDEDTNPTADEWIDGDILEFPMDTDRVGFRIRVQEPANYTNPVESDRKILLSLDEDYQSGRNNFAAAKTDNELRVSLNELATDLQVGSGDGFLPTDAAMAQNGRVFLAGYNASLANRPQVKVINQKGVEVALIDLFPRSLAVEAPPVIAVNEREIEGDDEDVMRYEFAVAFGVEEDDSGNPTPGDVNAVIQRWVFDNDGYTQDWELIEGTDENDLPRWVGLVSRTGDVLVSGVTRGAVEPETAKNDFFGSYVQRINTKKDGADLIPEIAWARKIESTSHDERVVGGGIQNNFPVVIGDSSGSVNGESSFGGKDAFFYSAESAEDDIQVQQVGTGSDENLVDGFFSAGSVWLVGNGLNEYRVVTEQGVKVLRRDRNGSRSGFLLGYTFAGAAMEAYAVNDADDQSEETLTAAMIFDQDLIAAGSTTGSLTDSPGVDTNTLQDPALFRRNRQPRFEEDEDDDDDNDDSANKTLIPEPAQQWDRQLAVSDPGTGAVEALLNYRTDEITAIVRFQENGDTTWALRLFDAEGDALNAP